MHGQNHIKLYSMLVDWHIFHDTYKTYPAKGHQPFLSTADTLLVPR